MEILEKILTDLVNNAMEQINEQKRSNEHYKSRGIIHNEYVKGFHEGKVATYSWIIFDICEQIIMNKIVLKRFWLDLFFGKDFKELNINDYFKKICPQEWKEYKKLAGIQNYDEMLENQKLMKIK